MITFKLHNDYSYHSEWEELTRSEALKLFSLIRQMEGGNINLETAQAEYFMYVAKIRIPKGNSKGLFWENIYQMARMFRFFFEYHYEGEAFKNLSIGSRTLLRKYLPSELPESPEMRVASKLIPGFRIDCVFGYNLIDFVKIGRKKYTGYIFKNENEFIKTSLTAQQYVEASAVANKYVDNNSEDELNLLASILYSNEKEDTFEYRTTFSKLDIDVKYAIWRNFRAICDWLSKHTQFSILWAAKSEAKKGSSTIGSIIYSVSKAGYGTPDQIGKMNLMSILEIMKQMVIDNIKAMKDAEMKLPEIAEKTGLPINIITQHI